MRLVGAMLTFGFALGRLRGHQLCLHLDLAQLLWMMKVHRLRHVRSHLRAAKAYGLLVGHVQLRPTWLDATGVQLMGMLVQMTLLALAALTLTRLGVRFAQARRCDRRHTRLQLRLRSLAVPADGSTALPLLLVVILICIVLALVRFRLFVVVACLVFVLLLPPIIIIIIIILDMLLP